MSGWPWTRQKAFTRAAFFVFDNDLSFGTRREPSVRCSDLPGWQVLRCPQFTPVLDAQGAFAIRHLPSEYCRWRSDFNRGEDSQVPGKSVP